MSLRAQITEALKDAMRAKHEREVGAIRLIIAEMRKRDIVMGELKKAYTGQMDFAQAGALVKAALAG